MRRVDLSVMRQHGEREEGEKCGDLKSPNECQTALFYSIIKASPVHSITMFNSAHTHVTDLMLINGMKVSLVYVRECICRDEP